MRIVVVGAGALGGYFGGLLARDENEVTFLARGRSLEALRRDGLVVRSKLKGNFTVPVAATDDPASITPPDLIFLAVKAYDLESATRMITPLVGADTTLLAVQNGIDHPERIAQIVDRSRIVPGVVQISATVREPGSVDQVGGPGRMLIGELDGPISDRVRSIEECFARAGIAVEIYDDIWPHLWFKFMFICAMSGVSALTRLTLQEIFDEPEARAFYLDVMREVAAVATASGSSLGEDDVQAAIASVTAMPQPPERGSMAYDLLAGRRLEVETLNGTVVRLGRERKVPTPMNRAIYASLLPLANGPTPSMR
jgi:2-dehydropantoate 2-reductase